MKKIAAFCVGISVMTVLAGCGAVPGGGVSATASSSSFVSKASSQATVSSEESSIPHSESSATESKAILLPSSAASSKPGGTSSYQMTSTEYKQDGTDARAEYPQLYGKAYAGANAALSQEARSTIENVKKNPKDEITAETKGSIQFCSSEFVSAVFITDFMAKGAAHPSKALRAVNYDLKNNRTVTREDLVVNNAALNRTVGAAVKRQLSKELQAYFTPQVLKDSLEQADLYFTKNGMNISFTVLYALGDHVEVSIPYSETKEFRTNSTVWDDFR